VNLTVSGLGCDDKSLENLDARSRLVMAVLQELEVPDSKWTPLLETLQLKESNLPLSWSQADGALLRGSGLLLKVQAERTMYENEYKSIVEACPNWGEMHSLQQFLQTGGMVGAQGSGEEAIIPFFDLVNHDNAPNAEIGNVQDEGIFALVSTRAIHEGEEIVISYTDGPADLSTFSRYGFVDDKAVATGNVLFPACIPPSLMGIAEDAKAVEGEAFEGFSPELFPCCEDSAHDLSDKACFAGRVRQPKAAASFPFLVGPIKKDGTQGQQKEESEGDLSELLVRFRTLVTDAGFSQKCSKESLDTSRPTSMGSELLVMRLLKSLLDAHLDESAWVAGSGKPPPAAASAEQSNVQLVRKVMRLERGVFKWYAEAADFVMNFLELYESDGAEALKKGLCERFPHKAKKVKGKLDDFGRFDWFVERVLAPLAFLPNMEKDEACSVKEASYKMKAKECKEVLQAAEGHHSEL